MIRFSACVIAFGAALLSPVGIGGTSAGTTFDLKNDFSLTMNPNGPWSYNLGGSALTALVGDWGGVPTLTAWTTTATAIVPPAWGIASAAVVGAHDWLPGDVVGHSTNGAGSTPANVLWTAPTDGFISITGRVWDAAFAPGRNANWRLALNGTILASGAGIAGTFRGDAAAQFANNIAMGQSLTNLPVIAGDIVRFDLLTTSAVGHFAGVDLSIAHEIPAPAAALLLGLLPIAAARCR